MSRVKWINYTT